MTTDQQAIHDRLATTDAVVHAVRRRLRISLVMLMVEASCGLFTLLFLSSWWLTLAIIGVVLVTIPIFVLVDVGIAQRLGEAEQRRDELARTLGTWAVRGVVPHSGDPVTLSGRMVYDDPADVGRLQSFVHVGLDTDDDPGEGVL